MKNENVQTDSTSYDDKEVQASTSRNIVVSTKFIMDLYLKSYGYEIFLLECHSKLYLCRDIFSDLAFGHHQSSL